MPLRLKPVFKDYIWGGNKLREDFNKNSSLEKIAESWELSCHKDGLSVIENGIDAGLTLNEYIEKYGRQILGSNCEKFENFPVLIKLIDAHDDLSLQVHPDDEYALRVEGEYGKTEMWYIVDCEENSSLIYGFKENISKEEFRKKIESGTLTDSIKKVPVRKGDVFFISSGTIHAIGKGIIIAEIQQNSNTTYRIYDYGRTDKNGNSRELHIDKACDVTNLCPAESFPYNEPVRYDGYMARLLASCKYFTVHLLDIEQKADLKTDETSFEHILVINGECILKSSSNDDISLKKGDSVFIPAGYGDFSLCGNCLIIKTRTD